MQSRENHLAGIARRLAGVEQSPDQNQDRDSEHLISRMSSFPEHNPNPVVETDLDGNVTYLNPTARELGQIDNPRMSTHPLAQDIGPLIGRLTREGGGVISREIVFQGSSFEQKLLYIPEETVIRIYSSDVTRLKAAQEAMRMASEEANALAFENQILGEIGRVVSSSLDINDVYAGFSKQLSRLIEFDRLAISLVDLEDNTFTNAYISGDDVEGRQPGQIALLDGTVTNEAVLSRRAMIVQGTPEELEARYPNLIRHRYPSVVLAPLIYRGELFGVLNARSTKMHAYTDADTEIMSRVAAQIAPTIANSLLYADIVRTQQDLARSNTDLEQFAYAASHDLQEPLRTITSYLDLITSRYADRLDDTAMEFMGFAMDGAQRMRTLINDLLEYSRVDVRGQPLEPVNCNSVLDAALSNLGQTISSTGAKVESSPLPVINGDESQLSRLFQNLIGNALKFRDKRKPRVQIWAELQGEDWVFAIKDNGIGIDPEYQAKVFGMFARLHSQARYSGSGIGLALCSKIAQRHGGQIWVESEPGKGSTFRFTIPVVT